MEARAPERPGRRWPAAATGVAYALGYLWALGDLAVAPYPLWGFRLGNLAPSAWLQMRSPFRFEALALADLGHLVMLLSPLNLAIAATLGTLLAVNVYGAVELRRRPGRCRVASASLLGAVPALLAGGACCAPALLLLLGVPALGAFAALFGWLVPLSLVLLLASRVWQLTQGAPRWRGRAH